MKTMQFKRLYITIKKYIKLVWEPEEEFDAKYYEIRVRDLCTEIMTMPVSNRFNFLKSVQESVLQKTTEERDSLQKQVILWEKNIKLMTEELNKLKS